MHVCLYVCICGSVSARVCLCGVSSRELKDDADWR